jgi:hypothetical protein
MPQGHAAAPGSVAALMRAKASEAEAQLILGASFKTGNEGRPRRSH